MLCMLKTGLAVRGLTLVFQPVSLSVVTTVCLFVAVTGCVLGGLQCGLTTVCPGAPTEAGTAAVSHLPALHLLLLPLHRGLRQSYRKLAAFKMLTFLFSQANPIV